MDTDNKGVSHQKAEPTHEAEVPAGKAKQIGSAALTMQKPATQQTDESHDAEDKNDNSREEQEPIYDRHGVDAQGYDINGWKKFVHGVDSVGNPIIKTVHKETGTAFGPDGFSYYGYDKQGYNHRGLDHFGYDRDGFDLSGWNREGIHRDTGTRYDPAGRDKEGFPEKKFDEDGYDWRGYDKDGYDRNGFDYDGRDRRGYNAQGWGMDGINRYTLSAYDIDGYNENGYDKDGYNRDGYDRYGYDRQGRDQDGYDTGGWKDGLHKDTGTEYNPDGFNQDGYDVEGFNQFGVNQDGYLKTGEKDRDVAFAEDFISSGSFSKRDYAERNGLSERELDQKLKIAEAKCPKIESAIRDFLEASNKSRVAKIRSDCADFMDGGLGLYEFWDKHPRLSAYELFGGLLPNDGEKRFFAEKTIAEIELSPDKIEDNLDIFSDTGHYSIPDALTGLRRFRSKYASLPPTKTSAGTKAHRECAAKIQKIEKYFGAYKSQDYKSLVGMRYRDVDGLDFAFTEDDVAWARSQLKDTKRLVCKRTVQQWIVDEKKGLHNPENSQES